MRRFPNLVPMTEDFLLTGEGTALAVTYLVSNGWFRDISNWVHPRTPSQSMTTLEAVHVQCRLEEEQHAASETADLQAAGWILREDLWSDTKGVGGVWPTRAAHAVQKHREHQQSAQNARVSQLDRNGWIRRLLNAPGPDTLWRSPYTGNWLAFSFASEEEQKELKKRGCTVEKQNAVVEPKPFSSPHDQIDFITKRGWFTHKQGYGSPRDLEEDPAALSAKDAFLDEYSFQQALNLGFESEAKKGLLAKGWKKAIHGDIWYDPCGDEGLGQSLARTRLHWWNADFIQKARDDGKKVRGIGNSTSRELLNTLFELGWVQLSANGRLIPFWFHDTTHRMMSRDEAHSFLLTVCNGCAVCQRPFEYRKAREGGWDDRTCSPACARVLATSEQNTADAVRRAEIAQRGGPAKE